LKNSTADVGKYEMQSTDEIVAGAQDAADRQRIEDAGFEIGYLVNA